MGGYLTERRSQYFVSPSPPPTAQMAPDQIIVACCQADARYPEWDLKMLKSQRRRYSCQKHILCGVTPAPRSRSGFMIIS